MNRLLTVLKLNRINETLNPSTFSGQVVRRKQSLTGVTIVWIKINPRH